MNIDNVNNISNMGAIPQDNTGYGQVPPMMNYNPQNLNQPLQITSLNELQMYAQGCVVRLPDFSEGQPLVARIRRPSLLVLAKQGKIPNSLLTTAGELFTNGGGGLDADNENMLSDMYNIMEIIATAALIQPSMADIKSAGLELSDEQMMAIFNYSQTGIKALEPFRQE